MADLPPGFQLEAPGLPPGFQLEGEQPGFLQRTWNAFKGNATEDRPDVISAEFSKAAGYDVGTSVGQAVRDAFGNDQDSMKYALAHANGAKETADANGNPMLEFPGGQRFYVNVPGFSGKDVFGIAGKIGEFAPATRVAGLARSGAGLLAGAATAGLGAGATEAGVQQAIRGAIDPYDVGLASLFGTVGEVAGPAIGRLASAARNAWRGEDSLKTIGKQLADSAGLTGLSDEALMNLGRRASEAKAGADPKALAAQAEFGLNLTKGQKTGDFGQLSSEEAMRMDPANLGGSYLREQAQANQAKLGDAFSSLVNRVGGGEAPGSVADAFATVKQGVQDQAASLKSAYQDAYNVAGTKNAWVKGDPLADLQQRALQAVNVMDEQLTPATLAALKDVGTTAQKGTLALKDADLLRRRLSDLIGAGKNPTDAANVTRIKGQLDNWLNDAVDNALMQGDEGALAALKNARGLRAEYGRRFQAEDRGGKLVQQMIEDSKSPEEMANLVLGSAQVSNAASASTVKALKSALGDSPEAWNALRSSVLMKASTRATGQEVGPQQLVSNIRSLINSRPTLMQQLYSPQEISELGRFSNAVESILPKGDFARSSGTAERIFRAFGANPIISKLMSQFSIPAQVYSARAAMGPVSGVGSRGMSAIFGGAGTEGAQNYYDGQ